MSDVLAPLRHVYDVEPSGPPPAPGGPESVEWEVLRGARAALDAHAPPRPPASVVDAVLVRAAEVTPAEAPVDDPALAALALAAGLPCEAAGSDAERALLAQMLGALDRLRRPRPSAQAVDAVLAQAGEAAAGLAAVRSVYEEGPAVASAEADLLRPVRQAVERALASRPQPRPSAAAVEAVLARAAESVPTEAPVADLGLAPLALAAGLGAGVADASGAEGALLAQTFSALDAVPRRRPSADVLDAVRAAAAEASAATDGLAAVRSVYDEGSAVVSVEADVLRSTRHVVERALASRPQPRPSAAAVDAVLARAAESAPAEAPVEDPALAPLAVAAGLPVAAAFAPSTNVESVLLAQTLDALDRLPRSQPPADALDKALAQIASRPGSARRAADRSPAPAARHRTPVGVWAGAAGLVLIALVAVLTFPTASRLDAADTEAAPAEAVVADATPLAAPPPEPADEGAADGEVPATPPPSAPPALVAAATPTAAPAAAPVQAARPAQAQTRLATATTADRPSAPPTWEADDDLRALSLRLQELDRETGGLVWDEPAETFAMPAVGPTSAFTPGVRAVREGAPPARVRYRPDSSRVQR